MKMDSILVVSCLNGSMHILSLETPRNPRFIYNFDYPDRIPSITLLKLSDNTLLAGTGKGHLDFISVNLDANPLKSSIEIERTSPFPN